MKSGKKKSRKKAYKILCLPVCRKHPKYKGLKVPSSGCNCCSAIYLVNNQDNLCACEYDIRKKCGPA